MCSGRTDSRNPPSHSFYGLSILTYQKQSDLSSCLFQIKVTEVMPNKALTHSEFRKLVCGVCLRKEKHTQSITPNILALIREHHYEEYSLEQEHLPVIVCKSCVMTLKAQSKDQENARRKLPQVTYDDLQKPRKVITRSADNTACQCLFAKLGDSRLGNTGNMKI